MKRKTLKLLVVTVAATALLGGGAIYQGLIPLSFAADEHGHEEGHDESEGEHGSKEKEVKATTDQ